MSIDKAVDSAKLDAKFSAIADAIRAKTGGTETMTEDEMPEKVDKVFAAGEKSEWDRFWDAVQAEGTRNNYKYAFSAWKTDYIRPKYRVIPTDREALSSTFSGATVLDIEPQYFDFSKIARGIASYTFYNCKKLTISRDIGIPAEKKYDVTWTGCELLTEIECLRVAEDTEFNSVFNYAASLKELRVDGIIGQNGFDVHWSTKLTHDSLMSIISALQDKSADTSGTEWKVTLGTENLAKLSEEEISVAEEKGWVLA